MNQWQVFVSTLLGILSSLAVTVKGIEARVASAPLRLHAKFGHCPVACGSVDIESDPVTPAAPKAP